MMQGYHVKVTSSMLLVLVEKMGVPDPMAGDTSAILNSGIVKLGNYDWWIQRSKRLALLECDCDRKSMGVIVTEPMGQNRLLVKGAMENLLERSAFQQLADGLVVELDDASRELLLRKFHQMSSKALCCLGLFIGSSVLLPETSCRSL